MSSNQASQKMYDVAIVGYGPAGITAGIYGARKQLTVVLIGELPGGEVRNSGVIENWPGGRTTDGIALADALVSHLNDHKDRVTIVQDIVTKVVRENDEFMLQMRSGNTIMSKTVIYTAGRHPRTLNIPGEETFKNKGVSYCATCDSPLFSGKDVAVIGGGNTGAEAVIMLQPIANNIYMLQNIHELTADPILVQNFEHDPKVKILYDATVISFDGEQMVQKLLYKNAQSKVEQEIAVQGIFVAIGSIPNTEPIRELIDLDKYGAINADRYGKTSVDGFFAAGDVTDIRDAQIITAAGHGCSAAISAWEYLSRVGKK